MKIRPTPAFIAFARAAAQKCEDAGAEILFLNYTYVETSVGKGYKWVLNVVKRADFPRTPIMIVNGWKIFYRPDQKEQLTNSILDFQRGQIIVRPLTNEGT